MSTNADDYIAAIASQKGEAPEGVWEQAMNKVHVHLKAALSIKAYGSLVKGQGFVKYLAKHAPAEFVVALTILVLDRFAVVKANMDLASQDYCGIT